MSRSFIDRNQQQNTNSNYLDVEQKKIDPVAQAKWINNHKVDQGWGVFGNDHSSSIQKKNEKETNKGIIQSGGILIKGPEALELLKLGLSPEEANYIRVLGDGRLDLIFLLEGKNNINVGGNYNALVEIAQSSKTVELIVSDTEKGMDGNGKMLAKDEIPFQFQDPVNDARDLWKIYGGNDDLTEVIFNGKKLNFKEFQTTLNLEDKFTASGGVGKTSAPFGTLPNTEFDKKLGETLKPSEKIFSTNSNYQVYVNKRLLKHKETKGLIVNTLAHELYGHLLAMFQGKSSSHGPQRRQGPDANEWNYNAELEKNINERVKEAEANYNKRKE